MGKWFLEINIWVICLIFLIVLLSAYILIWFYIFGYSPLQEIASDSYNIAFAFLLPYIEGNKFITTALIPFFEIGLIFSIGFIFFIAAIKYLRQFIFIFLKWGIKRKITTIYFILLGGIAVYEIIKTYAPLVIEKYVAPVSDEFIVGIIAGLIVSYLTGSFIQEVFLEQRNNRKLEEVKWILRRDDIDKDDCKKVKEMLEKLDKDLHLDSQYYLGKLYMEGGNCFRKNENKGLKLIGRVAEKGQKDALHDQFVAEMLADD